MEGKSRWELQQGVASWATRVASLGVVLVGLLVVPDAMAQGVEAAVPMEVLFDVEGGTGSQLASGDAVSSIVMRIPPGREQATPRLALRYSSAAGQSPIGYGWSLPIGSIRRSARHGVPRCSGPHVDDFVLELDGAVSQLVGAGGGAYYKKIELEYGEAHADPSANTWTYFDLVGLEYVFGGDEDARTFRGADTFLDTVSCAFTSRWELTRVADPNGNSIDFEYAKLDAAEGGRTSYPTAISYGANPGAGVAVHPYRIELRWKQNPHPRTTHASGDEERVGHLLDEVDVSYKWGEAAGQYKRLRTYRLEHDHDPVNLRALLVGFSEVFSGLSAERSFAYTPARVATLGAAEAQPPAPALENHLERVDADRRVIRSRLLDMNGDGFADLVRPGSDGSWNVHLGGVDGLASTPVAWVLPDVPACYEAGWSLASRVAQRDGANGVYAQWLDLVDLTGDGLPDIVNSRPCSGSGWQLYLNAGCLDGECGFTSGGQGDVAVQLPSGLASVDLRSLRLGIDEVDGEERIRWQNSGLDLVDMDGDGLLDLVSAATGGPCWNVHLNQGPDAGGDYRFAEESLSGYCTAEGAHYPTIRASGLQRVPRDLLDFNGDGLPDLVEGLPNDDAETDPEEMPLQGAAYGWFATLGVWDADGRYLGTCDRSACRAYPGVFWIGSWYGPGFDEAAYFATGIRVFLNTGSGFDDEPIYSPDAAARYLLTNPDWTPGCVWVPGDPNPLDTHWECSHPNKDVYNAVQNDVRRLVDVTGDGLADRLFAYWATDPLVGGEPAQIDDTRWTVLANQGDGRLERLGDAPPRSIETDGPLDLIDEVSDAASRDVRARLADWNGDGWIDHVYAGTTPWVVRLGVAPGAGALTRSGGPAPAGLLFESWTELGDVTHLRYELSNRFDSPDPTQPSGRLPRPRWLVSDVRRSDGLCATEPIPEQRFDRQANECVGVGSDRIETLAYSGAFFDGRERAFRGFAAVTTVDSLGNFQVTELEPEAIAWGLVTGVETWVKGDAGDHLVGRVGQSWSSRPAGEAGDRTQIWLAQSTEERFALFDAANDQCLMRQYAEPDAFGRPLLRCSFGCHAGAAAPPEACLDAYAVPGQMAEERAWAEPIAGSRVRNRQGTRSLRDYVEAGGIPTRRSLSTRSFEYDDRVDGQVERGNLTRRRALALDDRPGVPHEDIVVRFAYDALGNRVAESLGPDPSRVRELHYDGPFHLYPTRRVEPETWREGVAEPVAHEALLRTDLRFGKLTAVRDGNGVWTRKRYDALGRLVCEYEPGRAQCASRYRHHLPRQSGEPGLEFEDRLPRIDSLVTHQLRSSDAPHVVESRLYPDARGVVRFTKAQQVLAGAAASLVWVVRGQVELGAGGRIAKIFPPYVSDIVSAGPPPAEAASGATHLSYALAGLGGAQDPLGRPTRRDRSDGSHATTQRDGRVVRVSESGGQQHTRVHDDRGRLVARYSEAPGSQSTRLDFVYDGLGRELVRTLNQDSASARTRSYDGLDRLIRIADPDTGVKELAYDGFGRLAYERGGSDASQHVQLCYDELGRLAARLLYDASPASSHYDAAACTAGGGGFVESSYAYDDASNGNHGVGRLTRVEDESGWTAFRYDARGRVVDVQREVEGVVASTDFRYVARGPELEEIVYPDGEVVRLGYDRAGRPTRLSGSGGSVVSDVRYDTRGRLEQIVYGNDVVDEREYHDWSQGHRLKRITTTAPSDRIHLDLEYSLYNDRGQILEVEDLRDPDGVLSSSASHVYDADARLAQVTGPGFAGVWGFDDLGNMTEKDGEALAYDPVARHQPVSFGSLSYHFDGQGRRVARKVWTGTPGESALLAQQTYAWDALGRLRGYTATDGSWIAHGYDFAGNRVSTRMNGLTTRVSLGRLAEVSGGVLTKSYFLAGMRVASRTDAAPASLLPGPRPSFGDRFDPRVLVVACAGGALLLVLGLAVRETRGGAARGRRRALGGMVLVLIPHVVPFLAFSRPAGAACEGAPQSIRYYHVDHRGSLLAVTDSGGDLVMQIRYTPYGEIRARFDGGGQPMLAAEWSRREFAGYETGPEPGLYHAGARFYDPELGHFLSPDPKRQFASPYAYGPWDPMNGVDPTGESWWNLGRALNLAVTLISLSPGLPDGMSITDYQDSSRDPKLGGFQGRAGAFRNRLVRYPARQGADSLAHGSAPGGPADPSRIPTGVTVGLGKGEVEIGRTAEGELFATATLAPVGGSVGVSVGHSAPPGYAKSRAATSEAGSVVSVSAVGKTALALGPAGFEAALNIGVNYVTVVTPTDVITIQVLFVDPVVSSTLEGSFQGGFRATGALGLELGAFRLR